MGSEVTLDPGVKAGEEVLTSSTTERVFKAFVSSVVRHLTEPPPSRFEQVNLTAVMERFRTLSPNPQVPVPSPGLPDTPDLLAVGVGGAWACVLLLVLLCRELCSRSRFSSTPLLLGGHTGRTLTLLLLALLHLAACGEAGLRHFRSPSAQALFIPAALTWFLTTLISAAFYHAVEKWRSPAYLVVTVGLWACSVGVGVVRAWEAVTAGVPLLLVYPTLTFIGLFLSAIMLFLDLLTLVKWTYRQRHCEVLEITPGLEGLESLQGLTYRHLQVSLASRATFFWFLDLLRLGWRRPLEFTDFGKLPKEEESQFQYERFYKRYLDAQVTSGQIGSQARCPSLWKVFVRTYWREMVMGGAFKLMGDAVNVVGPLAIALIVSYVTQVQDGTLQRHGEVVREVYYVGWKEVIRNGWVIAIAALVGALAQSTFSQASTHLVSMEGVHVKAALQAMVYSKSLRLPSTPTHSENLQKSPEGVESRRHEEKAEVPRGSVDAGTVINLSSEDADNIMTFFMHCHYIWAIPLKVGVIMLLLWVQLGFSAVIAAIIGILLLTPLQFLLCKKIAAVNKNFLDVSDERLRQTHELVTGVKLVKVHAWENVFVRRISLVRERELQLLHKDSVLRALMTFLTQGSGMVISVVTFGLYSWLESLALEPARVFSGLALFNQLTVPLFILPIIVSHTIRAKNSTRRLEGFFSLPEVEGPKTPKTPLTIRTLHSKGRRESQGGDRLPSLGGEARSPKQERISEEARMSRLSRVTEESRPTSTCSIASTKENGELPFSSSMNSDSEEEMEFEKWKKKKNGDVGRMTSQGREVAVSIQSGTFTWEHGGHLTVLENITTEIPAGGLTVVLGAVASGKSSLLMALLGELHTLRGQLRWNGEMSVALVSQHPWLMNASLRENIIFGRRLLVRRYQKVLQACALTPDIEILPAGDQTEIGERGINLSGGQRQRIAIARALYSDARTVILDAPLAALDTGVANQVWEEGIVQLLLRRRRTIIMATHLTHLTRHADKVIYLEGGRILLQGSPAEVSLASPELWKEWGATDGVPVVGQGQGRLEGRTARERWALLRLVTRISMQRSCMIRDAPQEGGEGGKEDEYSHSNSRLMRQYSVNRHISHNALLPGDECEYLPALTPPLPRHSIHRNSTVKLQLFRIRSSVPAFGRKSSQVLKGSLPRHSKSLPPQPRPLPRMRSSPAVIPQGNMLHRLFSSTSIRTSKRPSATPADKWHLGKFLSSPSALGDDLEEDLELEEEVPLEEDIEDGRLVNEEERERGRISKWNYVVYLKACGVGLGLTYLFCALAGQGVTVALDFWLGSWSGEASAWNATEKKNWKAYSTYVRRLDNRDGGTDFVASSVEASVLDVPERYQTFVKETMFYYYRIYALLSVISILLSLSTNLLGQFAAGRGRRRLHQDMLENLVRCSIRFFDTTPTGRIMNRFTTDTAMIDKELARSVTHLLFFVLLVTSAVVVNAVITPAFLAVAIPICAIYYAIQKFFRCSSRELKRLESLSRSPLNSHLSESVGGSVVIRAYGDQRRFTDIILHRLDAHVTAFTLLHAGNRWLGICLDYIGSIIVFFATSASLLWSTVLQDSSSSKALTPSMVGLAINYTLFVPIYLNWVVRFLAETEMCLNAVERVQHYANLSNEDEMDQARTQGDNPGQFRRRVSPMSHRSCKSGSSHSGSRKSSGLPPGWPLEGRVEFCDVTLTYDPSLVPVLTNLSFTISPGEKVGLCGRTGSGKTSLILSLYRLVGLGDGRILIDGMDVLEIPLSLLRASISLIPQDTQLFCGTVRFNLDPLGQRPDQDIWKALEVAQLKAFISAMPKGLDTEISEGGRNLSAGQRQLFCVARAILRRSSLLILDEASSALDVATETALRHALHAYFEHATVITIAHGISSLLEYPRVLVLENGKLVEDGDPKELAKKENGAFANLLKSNNGNSKENEAQMKDKKPRG